MEVIHERNLTIESLKATEDKSEITLSLEGKVELDLGKTEVELRNLLFTHPDDLRHYVEAIVRDKFIDKSTLTDRINELDSELPTVDDVRSRARTIDMKSSWTSNSYTNESGSLSIILDKSTQVSLRREKGRYSGEENAEYLLENISDSLVEDVIFALRVKYQGITCSTVTTETETKDDITINIREESYDQLASRIGIASTTSYTKAEPNNDNDIMTNECTPEVLDFAPIIEIDSRQLSGHQSEHFIDIVIPLQEIDQAIDDLQRNAHESPQSLHKDVYGIIYRYIEPKLNKDLLALPKEEEEIFTEFIMDLEPTLWLTQSRVRRHPTYLRARGKLTLNTSTSLPAESALYLIRTNFAFALASSVVAALVGKSCLHSKKTVSVASEKL